MRRLCSRAGRWRFVCRPASPRSPRMRPTSPMAASCPRTPSSPRLGRPRTPCCWRCPASKSGGVSSSTRRWKSRSTQGCGPSATVPTCSITRRGSPAHPRRSMRCGRARGWRGTSWPRSRAPRHARLRSQIWGMMGTLGHRAAVGQVLGIRVSGWPAWVLWRAVYWSKLPGVTRKFRIAMDWLCRVLLPRDYAQLNVSPSESITREHFEAGEVIVRQGDPGDHMYVMIDGEVEVVQQQAEGGERVVATLTQGAWFGEMALFNEEPRGATVRTMTNVNVLSLDRRTFQTLVAHITPLREAFERLIRYREAEDKARRNQHEEEQVVF